jgi:hypothetical protein
MSNDPKEAGGRAASQEATRAGKACRGENLVMRKRTSSYPIDMLPSKQI